MLPSDQLIQIEQRYPRAWGLADDWRKSRGHDLPTWPNWCFLPMAGWYAIVCEGNSVSQLDLTLDNDASSLAAIGAWRLSQIIYRFQEPAYSAIRHTVVTGELPCEVLYRLPQWSVYIETPSMDWEGNPIYGFWCHLEWDTNTQRSELRFLLNAGYLAASSLHIGPWTLTEGLDRSMREAQAKDQAARLDVSIPIHRIQAAATALLPLVSLVLYICSDKPDIIDEQSPGELPKRPRPRRTHGGRRFFPPSSPRILTVGKELSQKIPLNATPTTVHGGTWAGTHDKAGKFHYQWSTK